MSEKSDLVLTEAFHRLKRTSLLFSAGLIVLHFAYDGAAGPLKLPILGAQADVPLGLAFWLLWISAAYYFAGFVLEWRAARRANSTALKRLELARFEDQLSLTGTQLQAWERQLASLAETEAETFARSLVNLDRLRTEFETRAQRLTAEAVEKAIQHQKLVSIEPTEAQNYILGVARGFMPDMLDHEAAAGQVRRLIDQHDQTIAEASKLRAALTSLKRELGDIATQVHRERIAHFWGWEMGGAAVPFLIATAMSLSTLWSAIRPG